jgi:PAS domain S-box-containing protein
MSKSNNKNTHSASPESETFYRKTLDNMLEGCQILGHDWRYLYLNATAEVHNHRPNQELLGKTYMEMWPGIESTHVFAEIKRCMEEGVPVQLENRFVYPDGAIGWFKLSLQPIPEGVLILSLDITEYKRAEKQTSQMNRLYATLSQVNQMIVRVKDREDLYQSICDIAVQFGEFSLAWIGLLDETSGDVKPVVANGFDVKQWPFPTINIHHGNLQNGLVATAIRTSQVATSEDIQTDQRTQGLHTQINNYEFHSSAAVPFRLRERTIGVVSLLSKEMGFFKAEAEARLLKEMGLDISFALDAIETAAEHKRAEQALAESEERFSKAFYQSPIGVSLVDLTDFTIRDVNNTLLDMLGLTREQVIGQNAFLLDLQVDPEDRVSIAKELQEQGMFRDKEVQLRRSSGEVRHMLNSGALVTIGGKPHSLNLIQDITERKQVEKQLQFYASIVESAHDSIIGKTLDGIILSWNPGAERLYGYKPEEMIGKSLTILMPPERPDDLGFILENIKKGKRIEHYETIRIAKDGRRVDISLTVSPILGDDGQILGASSIARDISERKRAEELLRESEEKFSILFEKSSFAISLSKLPEGLIVNINEAFEKAFGYTKQEVIGKTSVELGINPDSEGRAHLLSALNEGGSARNQELILHTKSGEERIFSVNVDFVEIRSQKYVLNMAQDITERKRAETQVEYQARLLENVNDAVLSTDTQFNITSWNRAAEEMYGYKAEEVLGQRAQEIVHSEFNEDQRTAAVQSLNENGSYRTEILQYHRDGHSFWVDGSTFVLKESNEQIYGYVTINRDITQRKQAEKQIRRQLRYLNALRMIDIAISSSFDLHVVLDVVLQQVFSQLGAEASAVLLYNSQWQTLEYAASRGFRSDALQHTQLKLGEGYAGRAVVERKTIRISDLMETGSRLANSLLLEHESFIEYYGTPLIAKGDVIGVLEIYQRSHLNIDSEWLEFLETLAGQAAIAINNAQLFESLQRSNIDLEHRVIERTAELNHTNTELEHANRIKDEFLANMSHELRTPLTSILGLSESLLEQRRGSLNEHQQRSLQIIESSGRHLLELINDILDLSKIEAGKFDFYPQPISVDEICRASLAFIKAQAVKKTIMVTYIQDTSVSKIFADPRRLKQILVNLLSNAVKFTPENGEVILQVKADVEQDLIKFSVQDNGIGIAVEDLQRLFQPFVQVDTSLNRQYEGTGLGLALVQKLTDLHGGSVQVESQVDKGSRFTINLPCLQDEIAKLEKLEASPVRPIQERAENAEVPAEVPAQRGIILLADDNMPSVLTIGEYLESHGYEIVVAHDGLEAVEKADAVRPDLILMDIQMPVMNGLDAIARLRGNARFANMPIIALTALAMSGDRERVLLAGANEYMSKPVSLKALLGQIKNLLNS